LNLIKKQKKKIELSDLLSSIWRREREIRNENG